MITPVGNLVKTSLQGTVQTFSTSINAQTDDMTISMEKAFKTATEFTYLGEDGKVHIGDRLFSGVFENKIYKNGLVNNNFQNMTIVGDGTSIEGPSGTLEFAIDVNVRYNGVLYGTAPSDVRFDIYIDGEKIDSNTSDYCRPGFNLLTNKEFKVVVTKVPDGVMLPTEPFILRVEDINPSLGSYSGGLYYSVGFTVTV